MNSDHESKPVTTASDVPQLTRHDDTHVNFPVYEISDSSEGPRQDMSHKPLTVTKYCYVD